LAGNDARIAVDMQTGVTALAPLLRFLGAHTRVLQFTHMHSSYFVSLLMLRCWINAAPCLSNLNYEIFSSGTIVFVSTAFFSSNWFIDVAQSLLLF
jgi:hypothetical protein